MVQQIEMPEFLKPVMAQLPELQPSELLKVSMELTPKIAAVGEGEPIIAEGIVTFLGIPVPLPLPLLLQVTRRGEEVARPVGFGLTMPFAGTFRIPVATEGWDYGQYAFQALAFIPPGPPGLSQPKFKGIEVPRWGAEVKLVVPEGMTPGTIDLDNSLVHTVKVDFTISNTGNRSDYYYVGYWLEGPTNYYGLDLETAIVAGESKTYTGQTISVPAGATPGYYDGVVAISSDHIIPAMTDRKVTVFHVYEYVYVATLSGVRWYL